MVGMHSTASLIFPSINPPIFIFASRRFLWHGVPMPEGSGAYPPVGRTTPAGGAYIFLGQPSIFFVTVNAEDGRPWMNQSAVQSSLADFWRDEARAWLVGYYLIMPDHLHLFCAPYDLRFSINRWFTFWKRQFSRRHPEPGWAWQRRGFHHRMRNRVEYEEKLIYVSENPLRKALVKHSNDWPLQGRIHDLQWKGD